jgi:hypothetical protein
MSSIAPGAPRSHPRLLAISGNDHHCRLLAGAQILPVVAEGREIDAVVPPSGKAFIIGMPGGTKD